MAYNPSRGLVDLFGGMEDIDRKIICCVGNPLERFTEDALRIMRAVRFSAQLGFTIEEETRKALKVLAPNPGGACETSYVPSSGLPQSGL